MINYNSLPHGHYKFLVKAELPDGPSSEAVVLVRSGAAFLRDRLVPLPCALWLWWPADGGSTSMRLRQIRGRFALVLGERARLAREIHDTLAQGFVGISSQLDAVSLCLFNDPREPRGSTWIWRARWRATV